MSMNLNNDVCKKQQKSNDNIDCCYSSFIYVSYSLTKVLERKPVTVKKPVDTKKPILYTSKIIKEDYMTIG